MIRAVAWVSSMDHGVVAADLSWKRATPESADAWLPLIGRPVKYFSRMNRDVRACVLAASLAHAGSGWGAADEIGLLAAGFDLTLAANETYFRDYVAAGRSMGRGNLFIYTLPTSALGEVAIVLSLTGPTLHLHDDREPLAALVRHARELIDDREADGMLALWTDRRATIALALDNGDASAIEPTMLRGASPIELAQSLGVRSVEAPR